MAQNPANAVICLGHSKGVVTMWTPTVKDEAVMKILAHRQPLTSLAGVVTEVFHYVLPLVYGPPAERNTVFNR